MASPARDVGPRPSNRVWLVLAIVVVIVIAAVISVALFKSSRRGPITTGLYQFWSKGDPVQPNAAYIIIKGAGLPSRSHAKLINYEQAFALNDKEAAVARSKGWLARTCAGNEIHPKNIPSVSLLDGEMAAAIDWRSSTIARETNAEPVAGTYLDTLRPYFNPSFYDGTPCNYTDKAWRNGSADLVNQVRAKTGGKMIIANGAGMGSGKAYFKERAAVDDFLARARPEAVQIEHFARSSKRSSFDADFIKALVNRGIIPFAKCDGSSSACRSAFSAAVDAAAADGRAARAYSTVPV